LEELKKTAICLRKQISMTDVPVGIDERSAAKQDYSRFLCYVLDRLEKRNVRLSSLNRHFENGLTGLKAFAVGKVNFNILKG
jgi:hypothetical protein